MILTWPSVVLILVLLFAAIGVVGALRRIAHATERAADAAERTAAAAERSADVHDSAPEP